MAKALFDETQIFTSEGGEGLYQPVAFSVTSATSANPVIATRQRTQVLLFATQDCHIRFSADGDDALATDTFLPANTYVPFLITPGHKISAIRNSVDGTLHISPVL